MDTETTAHVGDFFGGVIGPVLSLLGILFVVQTIGLQNKQLEIQHKQVEDQLNVNAQIQIDKINEFIKLESDEFKINIDSFTLDKKVLETFWDFIINPGVNINALESFLNYGNNNTTLHNFFVFAYRYYSSVLQEINSNRVLSKADKKSLRFSTMNKIKIEMLNYCAANFIHFEALRPKFAYPETLNLSFITPYGILASVYTQINED
ncbi:hypothetical protein EGI26_18575 [Lacihabitans sp. CCS-44]|uniref:hypothetical protein n=1 Tax=Lacihabitans sp. CCS-44 TaxID=2487331 RepID=UPI0020CED38E|nr:hypothetical protein [Lacihabitans sp. CCS-44]MCP9757170.1 hypothetical protein [Lacihabitans sp. CCS-44]